MARFSGKVGFATQVETAPDVFKDVIVERRYKGDVERDAVRLEEVADKVNDDLALGNAISLMVDAYGRDHFHAIRYIEWAGVLWRVRSAEVKHPRLIVRMGGRYNGPVPPPTP